MPFLIVATALLLSLIIVRIAYGNVSGTAKLELGFAGTSGKRQVNADEYDWAYYQGETLLALADGIGSGTKCRTAARVAVHIMSRVFEMTGAGDNPAYFFRQSFTGANSTILRYIPDSSAGASLLSAVIKNGMLYYALAGNCNISVYRKGELCPLSEGHTIDVLARKAFRRRKISRIEALEAIKTSRIYNFVGKDGFHDLELFDEPVRLKQGDIIVMMTDGVYDFCVDGQLEEILSRREKCEIMAKRIIRILDKADHPEQDNASIILARVNAV